MALTIRERLAEALATALSGIAGVTFVRAPENDFDVSELPALGLWLGDEQTAIGPTTGTAIERMEAMISGHAAGTTGAEAETAAHDLYGRALAAVMADHTQGGLAVDTRKTGLLVVHNQNDEGTRPLAGFELTIEIEYWVAAADPTALAP